MAFFNASAIDLSKDFFPLGEQPRYNDALYLACEEVLARPAGNIRFKLTLTNPVGAQNPPVPEVTTVGSPSIAWEVWSGRTWQELKRNNIAAGASRYGIHVTGSRRHSPRPAWPQGGQRRAQTRPRPDRRG
jgi:hypothetical protein